MNARCALWLPSLLVRSGILLPAPSLIGDQVPVRHMEGRIHGFLVLRDLEDKILASGSSTQTAAGDRVTSELSFRFKDGSVHQETAVFSQRRTFRLLTYRLGSEGAGIQASHGPVTERLRWTSHHSLLRR